MLLVLLALQALPALAQTPSFHWSSESFSQYLLKPGKDRRVLFGARITGDWRTPFADIHIAGRADGTAQTDGGAVEVNIQDPNTFSTLEVYGLAWKDIRGPVAVAAFYGAAIPIEGGKAVAIERYPKTIGGGLLIGDGTGNNWAVVGVGRHDASGDGVRGLFTVQLKLPSVDRAFVLADGAVGGKGTFVRMGLGYRNGGTAR